jgi:hypothetical protein
MRWKIQLYCIIYAHALENTVISHYLRTCAGKYSYIALFTLMRWYFKKYCIKYSNIALFAHMRGKYSYIVLFTHMHWKIQLYRIIYAHALENTVISHYLRTCAGKYSYITLLRTCAGILINIA